MLTYMPISACTGTTAGTLPPRNIPRGRRVCSKQLLLLVLLSFMSLLSLCYYQYELLLVDIFDYIISYDMTL